MDNNSDKSERRRRWISGQICVDIIVWLCAAVPVLILFLFVTPYDRGFFCGDASISYPYKPDTVSASQLVLGGFSVSVFIVVLVEVLRSLDCRRKKTTNVRDNVSYCIKGYGVFLVGFVIEQFIVQVFKKQMGVLRPNFFDVCKPDFNRSFCPGYIANYTCSGNMEEIQDSRQSFPSGHASFSMYVAVFYCIYIQNRLEIKFSVILKFFLQAGLICLSAVCGFTRITDNLHHPTDVAAGFLLGVTIAIFVYAMVGKKVLNTDDSWTSAYMQNLLLMAKSRDYFSSEAQTPVSQTPVPLLKNDFLNMGFEKTPTTPLMPLNSPFNVRRPLSMPIAPVKLFEEV